MENKIKELKALLDKCDNEYYNLDDPSLSDEEYDEIKTKYLKLINKDEYDSVPGEALFNQFKHKFNINSLSKVKIEKQDEIRERITELFPVVIEPKFDGLTIVEYNEGNKRIDVTRGNGSLGEDVSKNISFAQGRGNICQYTVRCEAILLKDKLEDFNKERKLENKKILSSTRNAAAGLVRNLIPEKCKDIILYAYNVLEDNIFDNEIEQLEYLKKKGWNVTPYYAPKSVDDAIEYINNFDREALNYDIDGLVVKSNRNNARSIMGSTEHHPKYAFAVKFNPSGSWTTLKNIFWTVGRTGEITPNASFEEINITGSNIKKATLNNVDYIKTLFNIDKISDNNPIDTNIYVIKSNDVIPVVLKSKLNKNGHKFNFSIPQFCPDCLEPISFIGKKMFCTNELCKSRIIARIIHMASKQALNIKNLSIKTSEKIIEKFKFDKPYDILNLTYEDILSLDGFQKTSALNLYNNIKNAKNVPLDRAIYASGIPLVGYTTAKDIANKFLSYENLLNDVKNNECKELLEIKNIGDCCIESIIKNFDNTIGELNKYINILPINNKKIDSSKNYKIVITGKFDKPRSEIASYIESRGCNVVSSVSKNTDYLLMNPSETNSSKYKNAMKLNIKTITSLEELKNILE